MSRLHTRQRPKIPSHTTTYRIGIIAIVLLLACGTRLVLAEQTIAINFQTMPVLSYDPAVQDKTPNGYDIQDSGATLHLTGNTWKAIALGAYTITPNTVLAFDFKSDGASPPEINAVGFDVDLVYAYTEGNQFFQVYGSQTYDSSVQVFRNYAPATGWQTYTIPVGTYLTGTKKYLVFVNDRDANISVSAYYRNVRLYENVVTPPQGSITFTPVNVLSYDPATQDKTAAGYDIQDSGATLHLTGNSWKAIALGAAFTITPPMVLTFDFKSDGAAPPEINAVGFDVDLVYAYTEGNQFFQVYGSQTYDYAVQAFRNYAPATGWQTYTIPVGTYLTGTKKYLVFVNDRDANISVSAYYRNVRLSESTDSAQPPQITAHPQSQAVTEGGSVTFTVTASGPSLAYQWQKNSVNIAGATASSYTIHSVTTADAGSYRVIVSNLNGTVTSSAATLTVTTPPADGSMTFTAAQVLRYDPSQDGTPTTFSVPVAGTLWMTGNNWKALDLVSYTLTRGTMLEFDFRSDGPDVPDINAVGFDNDLTHTYGEGVHFFQIYGWQNFDYANKTFKDYTAGAGWKHYTIPVGRYLSGTWRYLVLVNDRDSSALSVSVSYRNIRLYEPQKPAHPVFSQEQVDKLVQYASGSIRLFTARDANNTLVGFPHTYYGTGNQYQWRDCDDSGTCSFPPWALTRGYGSWVVMNEVTLRFLSLAAAYKMGWLGYLPESARYNESWGQIKLGLDTLRKLQQSNDDAKFYDGTFHRTYLTTIPRTAPVLLPDQDRTQAEITRAIGPNDNEQSSDDNALTYMNLLILEGLVADPAVSIPSAERQAITMLSQEIRGALNLRKFYVKNANVVINGVQGGRDVIIHNYQNGTPSLQDYGRPQGIWDRRGAEGAIILTAMLLAGVIDVNEFSKIAQDSLPSNALVWNAYGVPLPIEQATYHSAMFIPGLRSLHGLPVTAEEAPGARYYSASLLPIFRAHREFADGNGKFALGSQAMSQELAGYPLFSYWQGAEFVGDPHTQVGQCQFPGNDEMRVPDPSRITGVGALARSTAPHAFLVPLSRPTYLNNTERDWLFSRMAAYEAEFFHAGSDTQLGWEAVIPWTPTEQSATWTTTQDPAGRVNYSDKGRPCEALNTAYIVLHIFDALNPDKPLASYNIEKTKSAHIAAYFDSGTPLPVGLFP